MSKLEFSCEEEVVEMLAIMEGKEALKLLEMAKKGFASCLDVESQTCSVSSPALQERPICMRR